MVAIYLGLGLLFFFTEIGVENFPMYRKELGCVMLVYGTIRLIMTIRKIKKLEE
jgi:hypothetical protein